MRAVSLFSGVGGFEIGFDRAGIQTVLQAEQDPWCLSVLARHWPHTERVNDVRSISGNPRFPSRERAGGSGVDGAIDLVYGGFPCQPFSVAGQRAGDRDSRNLWPEFRRVLSELRPRWMVAENVPGLLSIADGRYFGQILSDLDGLGFHVAWAILDAQHFGVPQRRRRVFIVGGPDRRACEQVLAVCESCDGHPAASRETREGIAYSLAASARGTGDGHGNAWNSNYVTADTVRSHPRPGSNSVGNLTLASSDTARQMKGADSDANGIIPFDTTQITSKANYSNPQPGDACHPLAAQGHAPAIAQTLTSGGNPNSNLPGRHHEDDGNLVAFNYAVQGSPRTYPVRRGDYAGSMNTNGQEAIASPSIGVRRLTPLECERLQGWPDGWTELGVEATEQAKRVIAHQRHEDYEVALQRISDSHRYRMIGNGVASPCAEYIGRRLVWVDALTPQPQ